MENYLLYSWLEIIYVRKKKYDNLRGLFSLNLSKIDDNRSIQHKIKFYLSSYAKEKINWKKLFEFICKGDDKIKKIY